MEARITVDGRDTDVESLWDWLRQEPELRGKLRMSDGAAPEGAMGSVADLVVQATAAIAGAGAMTALARSLSVWLVQRRSDLTVKVTGPDGRQVSVSARRVGDPEQLLRAVLEPATPEPTSDPPEPDAAGGPRTA